MSLYKRFQRLDKAASGVLTHQELLNIPEFAMNPLAPRILSVLSQPQRNRHSLLEADQIDFLTFAHTIAHFSDSATEKERLELALRILDCDGDNKISLDDIFEILKLMVGDNIPDGELFPIAQTLFSELISQARGAIDNCGNPSSPLSKDELFSVLKNRPLDFFKMSLI